MGSLADVLPLLLARTAQEGASFSRRVDGELRVTVFPSLVVNVQPHGARRLEDADVTAVRAVFADAGYTELSTWGASRGVSFRVRKAGA
jgi:hypothetical protein